MPIFTPANNHFMHQLQQNHSPTDRQLTGCIFSLLALLSSVALSNDDTEFFEKRIRPLLVDRCYKCHGAEEASASLRLDSRAGWQQGGESGKAIVPGKPNESLLIRAVRYTDKNLQMPPKDSGGRLSDKQIGDLEHWIKIGAPDPRVDVPLTQNKAAKNHWAFQPIERVDPPNGKHPVDFFINKKLKQLGFVPTEKADQGTLVRRATYDLHGLPPTETQLRTPPSEFRKLIKSLLASPRYGERWGRHWLDVARFADTKDGVLMYGDSRIRPFAYTYRDYVIRSFNEDKPFDRFVHEQIAADQLGLADNSPDLAAMGWLTLGRMFDRNRHDIIDDQIDVVTRGLLGLTVSCARCHDHKFDPIPTADYYSLYGVFASSAEPFDRPRIEQPSPESDESEKKLAEQVAAIYKMQDEKYPEIVKTARERTARYLIAVATTEPDVAETAVFFLSILPQQLRPQIINRWRKVIARRATEDDPIFAPWHDLMTRPTLQVQRWQTIGVDQRVIQALVETNPQTPAEIAKSYGDLLVNVWQAKDRDENDPLVQLLSGRDSPTWFPKSQVYDFMSRKDKDSFRQKKIALDKFAVTAKSLAARAMVVRDTEELYDPVIFRRGDATQPGDRVPRRFLKVVTSNAKQTREPFSNGSGRLELARAITNSDNPLTARVLVNRIWMHHFGAPLVENPSDFGLRTAKPSHPELLDYLASELIRGGWRLKPIHELVMTSATWRRASTIPGAAVFAKQQQRDPENQWLWRASRRRLDLESMRDTFLKVSGQLELKMYGRSKSIDDETNLRRTVYALVERQNVPNVVRDFDFASPDASVANRNITTVPQQALFALNSEFMLRAASKLASRVKDESGDDQIRQLHRLTFGRTPTSDEMRLGKEFVKSSSLEDYAQVLLMTNELLFVD